MSLGRTLTDSDGFPDVGGRLCLAMWLLQRRPTWSANGASEDPPGDIGRPLEPPSRDGEQPRLRLVGHAVARPALERRQEGIAERVLGARDVAGARSQIGDEPAVRGARGQLGGAMGVVAHIARFGRTSTAPVSAAGQRAAQSSAVSRSGTLIT